MFKVFKKFKKIIIKFSNHPKYNLQYEKEIFFILIKMSFHDPVDTP